MHSHTRSLTRIITKERRRRGIHGGRARGGGSTRGAAAQQRRASVRMRPVHPSNPVDPSTASAERRNPARRRAAAAGGGGRRVAGAALVRAGVAVAVEHLPVRRLVRGRARVQRNAGDLARHARVELEAVVLYHLRRTAVCVYISVCVCVCVCVFYGLWLRNEKYRCVEKSIPNDYSCTCRAYILSSWSWTCV